MQRRFFALLLATAVALLGTSPSVAVAAEPVAAEAGDANGTWLPLAPEKRPRKPWMAPIYGGALVFTAGYVPALVVGLRSINAAFWGGIFGHKENDLGGLVIPVYGAFKYAAHPGPDYGWDVYSYGGQREMRAWGRFALGSGIAQSAGLALIAIGLLVDDPLPPRVRALAPTAIEPSVGRGTGGLQLRWTL